MTRKKMLLRKTAQTTGEYAIIIGIVVAVVIAMQTYVKRGMQGRFKDASDKYYTNVTTDINWPSISGTPVTLQSSKQYEPEMLESLSTQKIAKDEQTTMMATGGKITRESTRQTTQAEGDYQAQIYNK